MATISRQELFERVWAQPVTKVAAEFGISDNGLRKICDRHDIPVPSRGYWAQVQSGRSFPRPKLRPVRDPSLEEVLVVGVPVPPAVATAISEAKARVAAVVAEKPPRRKAITVPVQPAEDAPDSHDAPPAPNAGGTPEHPKLLPTRKALVREKPDEKGFVHAKGRGVVPATVAPASVERLLAWLSDFLHFAEGQGARFHRKDDQVSLIVDEEEIPFSVEEKADRTPHTPTRAELAHKASRTWASPNWTPWPKYDHTPSGKLALVIEAYAAAGLRSTFGETATRRLSDMSGDILAAFIARAALMKENRRKAEIAQREAEAAQRRRERRKAFDQCEEQREKFVGLIADKLAERARLVAVLAHAEEASGEDRERLAAMAAWLRRRLAVVDALLSPTFLDISARYAKIDFDEARAAAAPRELGWYYPPAVELQLWAIDEANNKANGQSAYAWARDQGLVPDVERDPPELDADGGNRT